MTLRRRMIDDMRILNYSPKTIQTYTHVLNRGPSAVRSPADRFREAHAHD